MNGHCSPGAWIQFPTKTGATEMEVKNRVTPNEQQMKAFLEARQGIVVHRNAGPVGQLNIETVDPVGAWLVS